MSAHHLERRPGGESSTADIIITLNTNTAPSSEVEPRTLRQALCLLLKTNESLDNLKFETEVGPSNFRKPDQFGSLNHLNPNCSASILPMSSWISKLSSAAQSSTQISIIIHGNHPWSYEKVSETPSVFLTFISRFQTSDPSRSALFHEEPIPRFQNGEMPKISENLAALFSNQLSHLNLILSLIINPCSITFKIMYPSLNLTLF